MLNPGAVLQGRYQIVRLLGQGGMGAVYLTYDLRLGSRLVVVKENQGGDPSQFQFEANILAALAHPNLPRVGDHFVEPSGAQYLVMDYVQGQDLDAIVQQRGAIPEREALVWMRQILGAVEYLHANRIIHRDIKPQNIIITPQNQAVLVDFGVAKQLVTGRPTLSGARAATPGFSAPEQYRGGTDQRSDVYSLCATLYTLLTARVPPDALALTGGSAMLVPPHHLNSAITPQTEAVVLRGMSLHPQARYQSVDELRRALAGGNIVSSPTPPTNQPHVAGSPAHVGSTNATGIIVALTGAIMFLVIVAVGGFFVLQALINPRVAPAAVALASPTLSFAPTGSTGLATSNPPVPAAAPAPTDVPPTRMIPATAAPAPPTLSPVPARSQSVVVFEDDFSGPGLDSSKWIRDNNTGNTAEVSGGVLRLSSSGTRFPYIYTASDPFPASGDFRASVGFRYLSVGTCGAPIAMASFILPAGVTLDESNRLSSSAEAAGGVSIWFWHEVVYYRSGPDHPNIPLPGSYTSAHAVNVEYVGDQYSILADGARIFTSNPTAARPKVIWLGHNADLGSGHECPWDTLEVDYVKVESLP